MCIKMIAEDVFWMPSIGRVNTFVLADRAGYTYWKNSKEAKITGRRHWRCGEARRLKCPSKITTEHNIIIARTGDHIHDPDPVYVHAVEERLNS